MLLGRLGKHRKLFAFLREHRLDLFDDAFQDELAGMYRDTDEGKEPVAPALLAMALLLQAYTGASDREAVELTLVDARWQMVLGVFGAEEPAFSQGALQRFRERLIAHDMDRRLLERTVELAKTTRGFDLGANPRFADRRPCKFHGVCRRSRSAFDVARARFCALITPRRHNHAAFLDQRRDLLGDSDAFRDLHPSLFPVFDSR
jgi:hypothetical protein